MQLLPSGPVVRKLLCPLLLLLLLLLHLQLELLLLLFAEPPPEQRLLYAEQALDVLVLDLGHERGLLVRGDGLHEAAALRVQVADVIGADSHTLPVCESTVELLGVGKLDQGNGGRQR